MRATVLLAPLFALATACASPQVAPTDVATGAEAAVDAVAPADTSQPADASAPDASAPDARVVDPLITARPYTLHVPPRLDRTQAAPLVVLLHGYGASGATQELYFSFTSVAASRGYLYATPDGTLDSTGMRFWNATDACCNFANVPVDDVAYIDAIIDDVSARFMVDPNRVFLVGHSNGAFMSHRYGCERSQRLAGFVALAGVPWSDPARCAPTRHVPMAQVHGTADQTISYTGGMLGTVSFPSAATAVAQWAHLNGCGATLDAVDSIDLEGTLAGAETTRQRAAGCPADGSVDFWTIQGGSHIPNFTDAWGTAVFDWLDAHTRH